MAHINNYLIQISVVRPIWALRREPEDTLFRVGPGTWDLQETSRQNVNPGIEVLVW